MKSAQFHDSPIETTRLDCQPTDLPPVPFGNLFLLNNARTQLRASVVSIEIETRAEHENVRPSDAERIRGEKEFYPILPGYTFIGEMARLWPRWCSTR